MVKIYIFTNISCLVLYLLAIYTLEYRSLQTLSIMSAFFLTFWLTTGWAMIDTYKGNTQVFNNLPEPTQTDELIDIQEHRGLLDILRDRNTRDDFLNFLKGEWCAENLLFWEEVDNLHRLVDYESIRKECFRIYDKYFQ